MLDNDKHRYVPAEAVYAIFECKPKIDKGYLEYAADKAASVRRLKRTSVEVHTVTGPKPPKQLFGIIAGILAIDVDWVQGFGAEAFREAHGHLVGDRAIDCGFAARGACFDVFAGDGSMTFGSDGQRFGIFRVSTSVEAPVACDRAGRGLDGLRESTQQHTGGTVMKFDYSDRVRAFRTERVRLGSNFLAKLLAHRRANRDRLIGRLPEFIPGISIGEDNFKPQGSVAVRLIIQTQFPEAEYDIDDGLVLRKQDLVDDLGNELYSAPSTIRNLE